MTSGTIDAMTALGVPATSFMCSSTGPTGTCQGTTSAVQRIFIELQTEVNRHARGFGITKIATDGKIGPKTLSALLMVVDRLGNAAGANLDKSLEALIIEVDDAPTTPRDVALNAEAITAALKRDGVAEQPWSVLTAAQGFINQIIDAGAAATHQPPAPAPAPAPSPPVYAGGANYAAPAPPGQLIDPYAAAVILQPPTMPAWLKIALVVGAATGIGGLTAALVRAR